MCSVGEERPSLVRAKFCQCAVLVKRGQVWTKCQTLIMKGGARFCGCVGEERPGLVRETLIMKWGAKFCGCVVSLKRGQVWSEYQTLSMKGGRWGLCTSKEIIVHPEHTYPVSLTPLPVKTEIVWWTVFSCLSSQVVLFMFFLWILRP